MTNPGVPNQFKVGDKVRVDLEVEILKMMQEGHGGWNPRMEEVKGYKGLYFCNMAVLFKIIEVQRHNNIEI